MANSAISVDGEALAAIYKDLSILAEVSSSLVEKLERLLPARFGSSLWWEKETEAAIKSIEAGQFSEYPSEKTYLAALKKRETV